MKIQKILTTSISMALGAALCMQSGTGQASDRPQDALEDPGKDNVEDSREGGYYIVTRRDYRKCMFPLCGGVFVKLLNRKWTRCADGVLRHECHAVIVDLSEMGGDEDEQAEFSSAFEAGQAIAQGHLVQVHNPDWAYPANTLRVSAGWTGVGEN